MRQVIVNYKVKPERVAENEALVRAVYDELARVKPDGLHYATFRLEDGVSFVHVAMTESERSPLHASTMPISASLMRMTLPSATAGRPTVCRT